MAREVNNTIWLLAVSLSAILITRVVSGRRSGRRHIALLGQGDNVMDHLVMLEVTAPLVLRNTMKRMERIKAEVDPFAFVRARRRRIQVRNQKGWRTYALADGNPKGRVIQSQPIEWD